nr:PREDICTED: cyclic GMP-AMP synthase [Latimeria chalumnae]|eukprot:XP_006013678.1 PREDICTED: cyclic GMP-AMP synthase [Latimeria chalumnae]
MSGRKQVSKQLEAKCPMAPTGAKSQLQKAPSKKSRSPPQAKVSESDKSSKTTFQRPEHEAPSIKNRLPPQAKVNNPNKSSKTTFQRPEHTKAGLEQPSVPEKGTPKTYKSNGGARPKVHKHQGSVPQTQRTKETLKLLRDVLETLKIKSKDRSKASEKVNKVVQTLLQHIKSQSECFKSVEKLPTGSYYEYVKISEPDEFDIMVKIPVQRVDFTKYDSDGAFYHVSFKRNPQKNPLERFLLEDGTLSASMMLSELRKIIKDAVKKISEFKIIVLRKKPGCPAVTLELEEDGKPNISLDIVLALEVHSQSWPPSTEGGLNIDGWLGKKVKRNFKLQPFYLVPKYTKDGNGFQFSDTWRISFSHIEKAILKDHGSAKTCCESNGTKCCRKQCLKLLKHLLQKLKQEHPRELSKFYSYHVKTAIFHACVERPNDDDWQLSNLDDCFEQFLVDFMNHLKKESLPHFFVPNYNLFNSKTIDKKSREALISFIEHERNNRFPIFQ